MLTLNTILKHEGLDPKNVRLIRHQDARAATNCTPYDLWLAGDGRLETYQRIQEKERFKAGDYQPVLLSHPRAIPCSSESST